MIDEKSFKNKSFIKHPQSDMKLPFLKKDETVKQKLLRRKLKKNFGLCTHSFQEFLWRSIQLDIF